MDSFFSSVYNQGPSNYVERLDQAEIKQKASRPQNYISNDTINIDAIAGRNTKKVNAGTLSAQPDGLSSPEVAAPLATAGVKKIVDSESKPPIGIEDKKPPKTEAEKQTEIMQKSLNMQLGLAGAKFLIDLQNADNAYNNTVGLARLNILQARNQASDALYRGRQAQLDRQLEGYQAGEDALLAMAAQGQDVSGQAVGKVQGSLETVGIFNGMQEQINSMREALGFELEEVAYEYQIDSAAATRQNAKFNAALELGASFLGMI